jgi:hypothetical protein
MAKTVIELIEKIVTGIRIPRSQTDRVDDYVMWKQDEGLHPRDWGTNHACFGGSMNIEALTKHRFECRSFERRRMLPQKVYLGTMCELREVGLIPAGMRYWVQDKYARFMLPTNTYDRHTVFTALSLYRHCDCHRQTMFRAWRLFERLQDYKIPYLQCLHYALGQLGYAGHTFISMAQYEGASGPLNPAFGWAMAYFGTLSFEERGKLEPDNVTTSMFSKLAALANPTYQKAYMYGERNPTVDMPSNDGIGEPAWALEKPITILHPQFSPLYTNPRDFREPDAFSKLMEGIAIRRNLDRSKKPSWAKPRRW